MLFCKNKLMKLRDSIKKEYRSLLATEAFRKERKIIQRISKILNKRYKIL